MATNKTVLIVEDEEDILALVDMLLSGEGYTVKMARNGQQGLESIREEKPGVILLDLGLPGMDASQFVSRVRSEFGADIPIVILSAARNLGDQVKEMGAHDFVAKPFEMDDLMAKVKKWTQRSTEAKA